MKQFDNIDQLGLHINDLMTLLFSVLDYSQRLRVMKALQEGELSIAPLYPFPEEKSRFAGIAHKKVFSRKERSSFWLSTPEGSILVRFPANSAWSCVYELMDPTRRGAKEQLKEGFK